MKQLTRKLFLSICTLAICAVTLVSTTFAWYTTNTQVEANGVQGTASTSGDASIYVSLNDTDWAQTLDLTGLIAGEVAGKNGAKVKTGTSLVPLQLKNDGYFYNLADSKDESPLSVVTFTLYFKTAKTDQQVNLYIENILLDNPDNDLPEFDNLLYVTDDETDGQPKPVVGLDRDNSKYTVDIVKALGMVTSMSTKTYSVPNTNGEGNVQKTIDAITNNLDLQNVATINATNDDHGFVEGATANALNYYNEVMKATEKDDTGIELKDIILTNGKRTHIATLPENGESVAVTFTIYINGWDEYCYDAVKGQTFNINFKFTSVNKIEN